MVATSRWFGWARSDKGECAHRSLPAEAGVAGSGQASGTAFGWEEASCMRSVLIVGDRGRARPGARDRVPTHRLPSQAYHVVGKRRIAFTKRCRQNRTAYTRASWRSGSQRRDEVGLNDRIPDGRTYFFAPSARSCRMMSGLLGFFCEHSKLIVTAAEASSGTIHHGASEHRPWHDAKHEVVVHG
jgi:hypothetical protein